VKVAKRNVMELSLVVVYDCVSLSNSGIIRKVEGGIQGLKTNCAMRRLFSSLACFVIPILLKLGDDNILEQCNMSFSPSSL